MPSLLDHKMFYSILSILIGLIPVAVIIIIDNKKKMPTITSLFLYSGWFTAAVFAIHLYNLLHKELILEAQALAPLGILLSALIASASVMKNIESQRIHEAKKEKRDLYDYRLEVYETTATFLTKIIQNKRIEYSDIFAFSHSTYRVNFIYPDDIQKLIMDIREHAFEFEDNAGSASHIRKELEDYKSSGFTYTILENEEWTPEQRNEALLEAKEQKKKTVSELSAEMNEYRSSAVNELKWIRQMQKDLQNTFMPYLKLSQ